jgi:hypothetical protein
MRCPYQATHFLLPLATFLMAGHHHRHKTGASFNGKTLAKTVVMVDGNAVAASHHETRAAIGQSPFIGQQPVKHVKLSGGRVTVAALQMAIFVT